jgi:hypothetical protein
MAIMKKTKHYFLKSFKSEFMKKEKIDYTPHFLTHVPGGRRLDIVYQSGKTFRQNNCHYPERYVRTLIDKPELEPIREAYYNGKPFYFNGKFNFS